MATAWTFDIILYYVGVQSINPKGQPTVLKKKEKKRKKKRKEKRTMFTLLLDLKVRYLSKKKSVLGWLYLAGKGLSLWLLSNYDVVLMS